MARRAFYSFHYTPDNWRASAGRTSRERYDWITEHLANAVEEAIRIRQNN